MKHLFLAILIAVACGTGLHAQDVHVSARADSNRFQIGQWITLHLTVDAPAKYTVQLPSTDDDFEGGEFVSAEEAEIGMKGDRREYRQDVVATIFDTGSIALRVRVKYSIPGDTASYFAYSPSFEFEMGTVALDTTQAFKDIKDVLHVPLTIWDYLLYAGVILLVLLAGWFGYRWYLRRKNRPEEVPEAPEPDIPAHIAALQALHSLREQKLWQHGEHKAYQSGVTDILRMYIERRFRVPAMEQTTSEIMPGLAMLGLSPQTVEKVERVLKTADLTKFAKFTPSSLQHEDAMNVSVQFVESTRQAGDLPAVPRVSESEAVVSSEPADAVHDPERTEGGLGDV